MTQEDKELLLQDLCARLPYGLRVKCEKYSFPVTILYAGNDGEVKFKETGGIENICTIKPYLFPLSSMTDKQKQEYTYIVNYISPDDTDNLKEGEFIYVEQCVQLLYFYHINHLDYRGLIEKGLAIDATGKNIY